MRSKALLFIVCIQLFLGTGRVTAQDLQPVPLTVPGISDVVVTCFAQDPLGALWLGTDRGLVRFDGAAVERYVSDPTDPNGLPHDVVYDLLIDGDELWVNTASGALRWNTRTNIHHAVPYAHANGPAVQREAFTLAPSSNGHWTFARSLGPFHFTRGDSVHRAIEEDLPPPVRASGGWEAPDGSLWYCDRMTMRHYQPSTHHSDLFPLRPFDQEPPPKLLMLDVIKDAYDTDLLWCRTWGAGFVRFNMRTGTFTTYAASSPLNDLSNIVYTAVQLGPERWLLNYDRHLTVLDQGLQVINNIDLATGGLFRTAQGDVLIGGKGAVYVMRNAPRHMQLLQGVLTASNVHAAATTDEGGYWSTHFYDDRRLVRSDREGRVVRELRFPQMDPPLEPFIVVVAKQGAMRGAVWVGSTQGLWFLANDTAALRPVPLKLPEKWSGAVNINAMMEAYDGAIWMCVGNVGVLRYDPVSQRSTWAITAGAENDRFVSIAQLDSAHLFAAQRSGLPFLLRSDGGEAGIMNATPAIRQRFTGVEGGIGLKDGRIVIFTAGHGVQRYRRVSGTNELVLDASWYLPDRPVFSDAVQDTHGRVWLTADRGAYLLDLATEELAPLDAVHGVTHQYSGRISVTPNGDVLLSGAGIARFDADFEPYHDRPELVIRSVSVNGRDRTVDALSTAPFSTGRTENNFRIAFSGIALFAGAGPTYTYRLLRDAEAVDSADLGRQHSLNLLGIPPGAYRLVITASGATSRPVSTAFDFSIAPAWWQTWWARTLFALAGVVVVALGTRAVLAVRYRRRLRELEREREVERVRMRIARDIHDGIGSGLTKITMMTRQLPADNGQAQRIAQASTELVSELGEIVWTVDPRNDSYGSFIAFVRSTLGKQFEHLSVDLHTDLHCDPADRDRTIGPELKRNVLLVMKEAVNNALKHSQGTRIDVYLELGRELVELRVSDNGRGFDPLNIREGANGLSNFRKRADAVHGSFDLHTGAEGTTIVLRAPVPSTNM